jgi:predicted transposase/invertase (TIGR01784 family)
LQSYLPDDVAAVLDLSSLTLHRDSFVDPDLQLSFSDMLYEAPLVGGGDAYVYVLFEHKSFPDKWVAFQLLRYMVRIWERALRQRSDVLLPPIIPLVVYHGRTTWQVSVAFAALIAGPDSLRPYSPDFHYQIYDLSSYSEDEIKGAVVLQAILLSLKYIWDPDLIERLPNILRLLAQLTEQKTALEYLQTLLNYVTQANRRVPQEELRRVLVAAFSDRGDEMLKTLAQEWLEEEMVKGLQQGLQQGWQQGLKQGWEQGLREELLPGIELGLGLKFGAAGLALLPEIYTIEDVSVLRAFVHWLRRVEHVEELQRLYRPYLSGSTSA